MEIKNYKKLKGNLYEVILDDGKAYKLYDDIILKYELLLDKKIEPKKLDRILEANAEIDAYFKALKYIGLRMRSELEIRRYLNKHEIPKKAINSAIYKLKNDGYLNQSKYTQAYINDALNLSLNGPRKIKDDLQKLGIGEDYIDEYLSTIPSQTWRDRIEKILAKKSRTNKAGLAFFKNKSYGELSILGYDGEDIKTVLDDWKLDTSEVFEQVANKTYEKLTMKYDGTELELRFKSKMFAKGFESEKISDYLRKRREE